MACLEGAILIVVVDAAELDSAEVLRQILLAHEEGTIISISPTSLLLRLCRPGVRVITPVSLPLEVTPWISELVESDSVTKLVLDLDAAEKTVRVITDETKLF